ncbi:hypothetical protein B1T44_28875, partial [Mycobacterium persicum]
MTTLTALTTLTTGVSDSRRRADGTLAALASLTTLAPLAGGVAEGGADAALTTPAAVAAVAG